MKKILALTVGTGREGQPAEPIVISIDQENPDYIVFFVTKESKEITLPKVIEKIDDKYSQESLYEEVLCKDGNDVIDCYDTFLSTLRRVLEEQNSSPKKMVVDYTTGTKAMSAALVMAGTSIEVSSLNYIAGKRENGIVISGTEKPYPILPVKLYWEKLHNNIIKCFNSYRFHECLNLVNTMIPMIKSGEEKEISVFLKKMTESYLAWDLFDIEKALQGLKNIQNKTLSEKYNCKDLIESNIMILSKESEGGDYSVEKAIDLYSNSRRRFDEGKYDDAVARIYRLIEYMGQVRLKKEYDLISSDIDISKITESCSNIIKNNKHKNKISLPLAKVYELLNCFGDPLGEQYYTTHDKMKNILSSRNYSILAHGFNPLGKDKTEEIFELTEPLYNKFLDLYKSGIREVEFPKLTYSWK